MKLMYVLQELLSVTKKKERRMRKE
jgi:hypothetical protein